MEPAATQADRRKGKHLRWKEAKIALAHPLGSKDLAYGGTLEGDAERAGHILFDCARRAGFGGDSRLHAVGDGASWIADQVEKQFGQNGHYLLDFYHVCDSLAAAAKTMTPSEEAARTWLDEQKRRLKEGLYPAVLQAIAPYQEDTPIADEYAPVRVCHRSLSSRFDQLHDDQALRQNLPIGSGEIESAHRDLVQQRLKRPGAWWRTDNAEYILALRINRAKTIDGANTGEIQHQQSLRKHQFESHPEVPSAD